MPARIDIFLDLDGTLIDPKPGIVGSILYALNKMGRADPPSAEELHWAIGPSLRTTFAHLLDGCRAEDAVAYYRENYRRGAMYDCVVYAGIPEALALLAGAGHRLHIVTAKPHVFARPIAERLGLAGLVAGIHGPELDGTRDDKGELLAHVLAAEAIAPERAVMIGDRRFDMLAAAANGVPGIGITWGYGTAEELEQAGASLLCHAPPELGRAVAAVAGGLQRR
ncbi:MAG: HAD hydrolase-like protein [Hyphomicrobiaceae bacterium]|nr:HAD hydrolase-like protein [Hyphomicrobiaceae bacterium]